MSTDAPSPEIGRAIEAAVAEVCTNAFFPDFVVRSPKYLKRGGQEKEAADILAVFGDTMLVLQVKTRILPNGAGISPSPVELERITRMLGRALDQFRSLLEAWGDPSFGSFLNERGLPVHLNRGSPKRLVLIVIYAVVKADGGKPEVTVRCGRTCHADSAIPIHIFNIDDFVALTKMLDTLPDFLRYLQLREDLQASRLIVDPVNPLDLWAVMAFESSRITRAVKKNERLVIDGIMHRHHASVARLEESERESYLIDWLIHELHAGSGRTLSVDERLMRGPPLQEEPGSLGAYQRIIPYFAQLSRSERGRLAHQLMLRVERSQDGKGSFGGLKFEPHEEGYLVFSGPEPRQMRHHILSNLGRAFAYRMKLRRVVCLGTGLAGPSAAGCDALAVEIDPLESNPELEAAARKWFSAPESVTYKK